MIHNHMTKNICYFICIIDTHTLTNYETRTNARRTRIRITNAQEQAQFHKY